MEKSPEIAKLATALVAFQTEMETVVYDADNPFYKSRYATLAALVSSSKDLLVKNGLAVSQIMEDECSVITILMHSSGEFISGKLSLKAVRGYRKHPVTNEPTLEDNPTPQAFGSAISYARRYSYAAILGLVSDKDDDANSASGLPQEQKTQIQPLQQTMRDRVATEGMKKFGDMDKFKVWRIEHNLVEVLDKATESELTYVWAVLREYKKK